MMCKVIVSSLYFFVFPSKILLFNQQRAVKTIPVKCCYSDDHNLCKVMDRAIGLWIGQ